MCCIVFDVFVVFVSPFTGVKLHANRNLALNRIKIAAS